MRSTLILGHRGFIGRVLFRKFLNRGLSVLGASQDTCNLLNLEATKNFLTDISDDLHIVLASVINRRMGETYDNLVKNMDMVNNLLQSLPERKIKGIVYLSSVDVYGYSPQLPIDEGTLPNPMGYYGIAKLLGEQLITLSSSGRYPVTVLRFPGVYGSSPNEPSVIAKFLDHLTKGEAIPIFGDGTLRRDFIHVNDACEVIIRAVEAPFNGMLNIASGVSLDLLSIVEGIAKSSGRVPKLIFKDRSSTSAGNLEFRTEKLGEIFPGMKFMDIHQGARLFYNEHFSRSKIENQIL